jgi:glycosyltransferase involved in cell wall biosynthesis
MRATCYSLIVPVYRNEDTIEKMLNVVEALTTRLEGKLELVVVVDGSPDRSYPLLRQGLAARSLRATLIGLSRNFGSFAAIRHGLGVAQGPWFAVMAADLQEPPELIESFFVSLENEPVDIVVGVRTGREDPLSVRLPAAIFWSCYRRLVQPDMPMRGVDVFGVNRRARDALLALDEAHSSLVGQLFWLGFRRKHIPYRRRSNPSRRSGWTLRKRFRHMTDSVFAFTDLPIRLISVTGAVGVGLTVLASTVVAVAYLRGRIDTLGYAPLVLALLFSTFLILMGLGVVGSYVRRSYENSKRRPHSVELVRDVFGEEST